CHQRRQDRNRRGRGDDRYARRGRRRRHAGRRRVRRLREVVASAADEAGGGVGRGAMELGSWKEGGRDGTLIVVDRAVRRAVRATGVAPTLQKALDDWAAIEPRLRALAQRLADDKTPGAFELDATAVAAPLPRAYQWADGSAYVVHVELVRKARGVEMPPSFWTDPLMYQGGSDSFIGPNDEIEMADEAWGIDFEGEIGVITDDVPMG